MHVNFRNYFFNNLGYFFLLSYYFDNLKFYNFDFFSNSISRNLVSNF